MQDNSAKILGDLLIVDDVPDNLRVLSNMLSNYGHRVRAVRNGAMALVGVKAAPPDVILLDIRMPEMDGYQVCQHLKSNPQTSDIPVIFLSALDEIKDKARAFEVGGIDYITKPFQVEEVLARVQNQLTIQQLKRQLAQQQSSSPQPTTDPSLTTNLTYTSDESQAHYNNLLSTIRAILDQSDRLSQNPSLDPDQHTSLRTIHHNCQRLLNLVHYLLEAAGQQELFRQSS